MFLITYKVEDIWLLIFYLKYSSSCDWDVYVTKSGIFLFGQYNFFPGYFTSFEMQMVKHSCSCYFLNQLRLSGVSWTWTQTAKLWSTESPSDFARSSSVCRTCLPELRNAHPLPGSTQCCFPWTAWQLHCSGINFPLWWSHNAGLNPILSPYLWSEYSKMFLG